MELIPGKRYRVSFEMQAVESQALVSVIGPHQGFGARFLKAARAEVELLPDPLPTTPGSVVQWSEAIWVLRAESLYETPWLAVAGPVGVPGSMATTDDLEGATVLFDAGATS